MISHYIFTPEFYQICVFFVDIENLASVKKVLIFQHFPQNDTNAKFEQRDGHGKLRNGHGKAVSEIKGAPCTRRAHFHGRVHNFLRCARFLSYLLLLYIGRVHGEISWTFFFKVCGNLLVQTGTLSLARL